MLSRGFVRIDLLLAGLTLLLLAAVILPAVQQAREAARRSQSANNLKQLGIAMHNYHETFETLPPGGTFAADGTPHHSWTLAILPYMVASPFYNQIDTNRPWNDPVNHRLFQGAQRYVAVNLRDPSVTEERTASGGYAVHYAPNQRLLHRNSSVRLRDIPDRAQTLLLADACGGFAAFGDPVQWRDATLPLRESIRGFGHVARPDVTAVLYVDGSTAFVSNALDPAAQSRLAGVGVPEPEETRTARSQTP